MSAELTLIASLVQRLATRLPHRTGSSFNDLEHDRLVSLTANTLIDISIANIAHVAGSLLQLLEELWAPYKTIDRHPNHVLYSELYLLQLLSDCCIAHWNALNPSNPNDEDNLDHVVEVDQCDSDTDDAHRTRHRLLARSRPRSTTPLPLPHGLVSQLLKAARIFFIPLPDEFTIPPTSLLQAQCSVVPQDFVPVSSDFINFEAKFAGSTRRLDIFRDKAQEIENYSRSIVEFVSASNWQDVLDFMRCELRGPPNLSQVAASGQTVFAEDEDQTYLVSFQLLALLWVDARKLSVVIQEISASFLHFRKSYQHVIAIVLPLLISRWIERNPQEFVDLHLFHRRLESNADTLFDMTNTSTMMDNPRLRTVLYPLQISLLLLLPDVWDVASGMRDAKSSSMSKKVAYLENLRKTVRHGSEPAAYCLVSLLRVARHFAPESDSTLLSYALDVQSEVKGALFGSLSPVSETAVFSHGLLTAALVSIAHLDIVGASESFPLLCLGAEASQVYKIAYVSACCYFVKQANSKQYDSFFCELAHFIRAYLQILASDVQRSTVNSGILRQPEHSPEKDLLYRIMLFLNLQPLNLFEGAPTEWQEYGRFFDEHFLNFAACLASENETIRQLASIVSKKLLIGIATHRLVHHSQAMSDHFFARFWRSTSIVLLIVGEKILSLGREDKTSISFLKEYMGIRLDLMHRFQDLYGSEVEVPERITAFEKLETVFLVSLCSPDIELCQQITVCIGFLCEENSIQGSKVLHSRAGSKNMDAYFELSSKEFRFTGLVAFQKRVRTILRKMLHPSPGILTAWGFVFRKWLESSKQLAMKRSNDVLDERFFVEWRNYSGFLASLGGLCISQQASVSDDSAVVGSKWVDRQSLDEYDESLLNRYLMESVQLLASASIRVREAIREVLATEIPPILHSRLFRILEAELESLFENNQGGTYPHEHHLVFAEQAAALLKAIVEKFGIIDPLSAHSIDVGALALNFTRFIDQASDGLSILRIKLKLCQLCEIVTQKKDLLNLRHDVRIRNQLLDIMFRWIQRPGPPLNSTSGHRLDEIERLQKDLDRACLAALADLTFRLPLQPAEGQTDAETSDIKTSLFRTYFNRFLSLLSTGAVQRLDSSSLAHREEWKSIHEMAIRALSNLLSANVDIGLRHCLSIGYNEDPLIRTAFVRVICNVLAQGTTDFHNLSDASMPEKYEILLDLLINDTTLTIALCDACPSSEVDELAISLLNIFDSRGMGFTLLKALIEHEVEETDNETELLRRNCVTTKMLSVYAKWKGSAYLKTTLQSVLERLLVTSNNLNLELDPGRTSSSEELERNAVQLRYVAKVFIDDICKSAIHIPASFRNICSTISTAVLSRFPDAKFTAVGAFIFLRFFCPAIVAPEADGLVSSPPTKEMRRGLLLIAKVVQNLANNVLFGAKESYMYPLNDFLTENIYRVTTFLREISVSAVAFEDGPAMEAFDFGSCVALHRFLYDHWDHVRQKLLSQERKTVRHSPSAIVQGRIPVTEALRVLVSNLGPPPMDISWNRPSISANNPPAYSRFQHFMLRNSGRSTESLVSSRAVYDGGESKDGLSIICIILRNIDSESIDYDLLVYCYLKIASRMWHRPFGILVDATCYNGQNEPQDGLFRQLDTLTPSELLKNLTRVYVYNMNSAFRKCFRRILRLSGRSENSAFHPSNVDYHLVGSLPELQTHFHLGQLNLPKDTLSMVNDIRFTFQPVTRLSKTKGPIDCLIKVGSQFVQVTTAKKQEIVPGLRLHATVNDIFKLTEVDEAPTQIPTADGSAFGLRTESGKIVMYFMSPRKDDIISTIQAAKLKYGKEAKESNVYERLIRPQDVPGTLLNIAFSNMASTDTCLRLSSYNLLCALCRAFNFAPDVCFLAAQELAIPHNPSKYIVNMSKQLALSEPQLTVDFLNEFFVGWESFPSQQRSLSLSYMAPWLLSLRAHVMINETEGEKAREKIAVIIRKVIDIALSDISLATILEQLIWPSFAQDDVLSEIFLEEAVKAAISLGSDADGVKVLGSILAANGNTTIRGKLVSRLRKALNRTSLRSTRRLEDNNVWSELCVLVRLCLCVSFNNGVQSQLFLPELFHLITMLANTGSSNMRSSVLQLLINTLHALCTILPLDDNKMARLKAILNFLTDTRSNDTLQLHTGFHRDMLMLNAPQETSNPLAPTEALASLLSEVTVVAAPTVDLSNVWRARWMSLVASTAFQNNPAIQPRAFSVMGCLAREDVDDDLLYQVLVALRTSINRTLEDNDNEMLIAIVASLTRMMEKLPTASRYGLQLFWLSLSLVRLVPIGLYNSAVLLLEATLLNINTSKDFANGNMVSTLLHGRQLVEDIAAQIDENYGIHFNSENFHFAICSSLLKGLSDSVTKSTTLKVLSTFLEIATTNHGPEGVFPQHLNLYPYVAILIARSSSLQEAKDILWLAGMATNGKQTPEEALAMIRLDTVKDKELLLNAALCLIDFRYLEDPVQSRSLNWLNDVALKRPTVILHLYEPVLGILNEVLLDCQNPTTLEAAHRLLRTITSNPRLLGRANTEQLLGKVLSDIGFGGLWRGSTFSTSSDSLKQRIVLADKLIELIIA